MNNDHFKQIRTEITKCALFQLHTQELSVNRIDLQAAPPKRDPLGQTKELGTLAVLHLENQLFMNDPHRYA